MGFVYQNTNYVFLQLSCEIPGKGFEILLPLTYFPLIYLKILNTILHLVLNFTEIKILMLIRF